MKKTLLIIIAIIGLHSVGLSQETKKPLPKNREVSATRPNKQTAVATEAIVDENNWNNLVPAAQKVYTKNGASTFTATKLAQVNYLYSKSFTISNQGNTCSLDKVNVSEVLSKRLEDKRLSVPVTTTDGCSFTIELLSNKEVQSEFEKIASQHK